MGAFKRGEGIWIFGKNRFIINEKKQKYIVTHGIVLFLFIPSNNVEICLDNT